MRKLVLVMKIIIYGLGRNGRDFIQDIQKTLADIEVVAVTDTYVKNLDSKIEIQAPCIEPASICEYTYDSVIITTDKYYSEIKEHLLSLGIPKDKMKSTSDFWIDYGKTIDGRAYCNMCENKIFLWKHIGEDNEIFHHKDIVGASRRRGGCPICGSSDRERYVYHVLNNYTDFFSTTHHQVLHFAPEVMLSKKLRAHGDGYISADITPGKADIVSDITHIQFCDARFDYIICNHVMEHISDERKAFSELRRCLRPGGTLVLTVPICWEQQTVEYSHVNTDEERIKYYGQKDHVRLYGNDIVERIEAYGFDVSLYQCERILDRNESIKMGFFWKDSVLLCSPKHS